jgi:hypothetical protein
MDPFTMLILASTALGANVAKNKDQNILEGALKGAALGSGLGFAGGVGAAGAGAGAGLGSGTGNVIAQGVNAATAPNILPSTISAIQGAGAGGAKVAATEAGKVAATETAKKAAADAAVGSITPTFTPEATTAIDAGRRSLLETAGVDSTLLPEPLKYKGVTNIPGSQTFVTNPTAIAANKAGGITNIANPLSSDATAAAIERGYAAKGADLLASQQGAGFNLTGVENTGPMSKILATAKDKPLETAYFASSVGSVLSPQGQAMQAVPYQPGSVQQTPSVEQSINENFGEQPQFIPRPLFEDMQGRSPEEMLLLQDQMMARGLV